MMVLPRLALLSIAAAILASGCAYTLDAQHAEPPARPVTIIAVGTIGADDGDREREARRFRRALIRELEATEAFSSVLAPAPPARPADAVLVTGRFHTLSNGAEGLRFLIGYGAGAPRMRASFEVSDDRGRTLLAFSEQARSFDGTGYAAHWNPADLDDALELLARQTADVIARWSRGESVKPTFWDRVP